MSTTTTTDWRTMEAGRELDALVAERVMRLPQREEWRGPWRMWQGDPVWTNAGGFPATCPHYSTDIAAAWRVVEEVQRRNPGWRFGLLGGDTSFPMVHGNSGVRVDRTRREAFGWRASFFGHEDPELNYGQRHADEHADTPALAICRAALAALDAPDAQDKG